jgi:hypothetical protein
LRVLVTNPKELEAIRQHQHPTSFLAGLAAYIRFEPVLLLAQPLFTFH